MRRALRAGTVVAVLLTACTAQATPTTSTTVSVLMADDWASAPVVRDVIEAFEREHEGVQVQVEGAAFSQIPDLVRDAAELGEPYDLAHWHAFAAGAAGLAEPVDDRWEAAGIEPGRFLRGAVEDVTWGGVRYGLPLDVNALVLLVDRTKLEEAGLTPEDLADADRFLEVAATLAERSSAEYAIAVTASSWAAYGWIRAFGGDLLVEGPDGPEFTFDDPATVAALDTLQRLVEEGVAPRPYAPDFARDAIASFTQGTIAIHATGSWDLPVTERSLADQVDPDDVLVLPLPRGEGATGTVLGGSSLWVPEGADEPDLAFAFARALTADDAARRLAEEEGRLPAARHLYDDTTLVDDPRRERFVEELEQADVMPLIAYPELASAFGEALELVLKGERDAATALAEVQERADAMGTR